MIFYISSCLILLNLLGIFTLSSPFIYTLAALLIVGTITRCLGLHFYVDIFYFDKATRYKFPV